MTKNLLKSWVIWVVGVLTALIVISIWKNEEFDWGQFISYSIVGLIGTAIGGGIRKFFIKKQN